MLVIKQKLITRADLKANPNLLYIFGDNLERTGFGGQAKEMRGEPNAFGFATKRKAAHGTPDCYFMEGDPDLADIYSHEVGRLGRELCKPDYIAVVWPIDGIGTGLACLHKYCPGYLQKLTTLPKTITAFQS